ncbi:hypothetical protein JTE90_020464 [Oedothorax gibbosus]|uniref:Heparan sulfate 2-O-sulfotransferase pipe n=1 Tax=Oedothorax gibbosus TaxID=931172 RepID=A0AAV6U9Q4_9ARAC|nr:hypothetical protein JTE90_020464 [Oedothorax gibbosus]
MKYHPLLGEELLLNAPRTNKLAPRCVVLVFVAGISFYCVFSVIQVPVNEITSARLESGSTPCPCCDEVDPGRLFYNRVPKCGSTTLITLMRRMAAKNDFVHFNSKVYDRKNADQKEQRRIVMQVKNTPSPCSFDQHVFFINFTKFGESPPVFMNVIRDPVERIISSYFYRRMIARQNRTRLKPGAYWLNKKFEHCVLTPDPECTFMDGHNYSEVQLPYFCGQEPECQLLNDAGALQKAKQNIERYYAVVGTLEHMNVTLQVLEATLPRFFKGAYNVYRNLGVHRNQNPHKEQVKEEIKEILRANLSAEYELYDFVRQRLHNQYRSLVEEPPLDEQTSFLFD